MKTKEEIRKQLIQEQDELQMIEAEKTSNFMVKRMSIAIQKSKISLLEWILDLDNNCDNAYFIARIDKYIHALQNARLLFETKTMEDSSNSEVEPSVQYVVKSEMMIMGIEYFKNHDGKHATWVKNIYDAKRYHSEQLAIEEITLHWGFFPNWHSVEEYKG